MTTYTTAEVAAIIGIHPNTVRLYEKLNLILKPERLSNGWQSRNIFERQWVLRDFKKYVGMSAEAFKKELEKCITQNHNGEISVPASMELFEKLLRYWEHQYLKAPFP